MGGRPSPGSGPVRAPVRGERAPDGATTASSNQPQAASSSGARIDPYYLNIQLPGDDEAEQFVISSAVRPGVVGQQPDAPGVVPHRELRSRSVRASSSCSRCRTGNRPCDGPVQVNNQIDPQHGSDLDSQFTLFNQQGSQVIQGSMQLIPIGNSLIYIRPIYVVSSSQKQPAFRFVVVFYAGKAVLARRSEGARPVPWSTRSRPTPNRRQRVGGQRRHQRHHDPRATTTTDAGPPPPGGEGLRRRPSALKTTTSPVRRAGSAQELLNQAAAVLDDAHRLRLDEPAPPRTSSASTTTTPSR